METYPLTWTQTQNQTGVRYKCGYCGTDTTPARGWNTNEPGPRRGYVLICTYCNRPSFVSIWDGDMSNTPAAVMGNDVKGLPLDLLTLYDEARKSTSVGAYTCAVLTCRKILMHVAVEKKAPEGAQFIDYVNFLAANNYIPPDGITWVDYIRSKSNEANHEIKIMSKEEAEDLIAFTEMLLRLVYEFKHRLPASANTPSI